ncbi:MAG: hypothetical protein H7X80_04885, partial [bacterium]|nr:hypothetical protein [Candidatus Kapabacteria bacterium]
MLALFALVPSLAHAQTEITVTAFTITQPYHAQLAMWRANPNQVVIVLQNTTTKALRIRLKASATSTAARVRLETKDDYPVTPIDMPAGPGPSGMVRLDANALGLFNVNAVRVTQGTVD